ncbi:hypothetical protein AB0L65_23650 [Nonomuraea sp. NPDC052116]|uniref:hypothetical protein n=1 Tax=Nonomuraea sp. NPDC052116 TaxID=3155665 RepID=UPI003430CD8E
MRAGPRGGLAIHNPGEGWVSLPHLIQALADELVRRGGRLVTGAGRCSVTVEDAVHARRHGAVETEAVTVLNTPRAAMRPHPGSTFAIDHSWYEEHIVEHDDGSCSIDEAYVKELLAEASALLQGEVSLRAASWRLGRKPIPGDGERVFGELEAVPGCHRMIRAERPDRPREGGGPAGCQISNGGPG